MVQQIGFRHEVISRPVSFVRRQFHEIEGGLLPVGNIRLGEEQEKSIVDQDIDTHVSAGQPVDPVIRSVMNNERDTNLFLKMRRRWRCVVHADCQQQRLQALFTGVEVVPENLGDPVKGNLWKRLSRGSVSGGRDRCSGHHGTHQTERSD